MKNNITGRVSIKINAPAARVWEALTTPAIIKQYFFGTTAISHWKVGSPIVFKGEWQGKEYEDKGAILDIVPNRLFRYSYWSSMSGIEDKPENYVPVSYELTDNGNSTKLTVIQENIPDEKMKKHSEENWNKVLKNLKQLLEKTPAEREQIVF
ncbi:MAG: SRPBCC family protein [Bacteroidota bacterium]